MIPISNKYHQYTPYEIILFPIMIKVIFIAKKMIQLKHIHQSW